MLRGLIESKRWLEHLDKLHHCNNSIRRTPTHQVQKCRLKPQTLVSLFILHSSLKHFDQPREKEMESGSHCLSSFIDEGSEESHRLFLARRTAHEMLRDRGYDVPDSEINLSLEAFRSNYGQHPSLDLLDIYLPLVADPSKTVRVIFFGTEVVKLGALRVLYKKIGSDQNLHRLILVLQNKMTPQAQQDLKVCNPRIKPELFQITDLLVNITKHVLMPKHEILSSEEKEKVLKKFCVGEKQIPRMLQTDAIARYYGLEKGTLLKVTTDSDVSGNNVTYRCVM